MRLVLAGILYLAGFGLVGLFIAHLVSLSVTVLLSIRLLARHYRLDLLFAPALEPLLTGQTITAGISMLPANMVARLSSATLPPILLNILLPGSGGGAGGRRFYSRSPASFRAWSRWCGPPSPMCWRRSPSSAARSDLRDVNILYSYSTRLVTGRSCCRSSRRCPRASKPILLFLRA